MLLFFHCRFIISVVFLSRQYVCFKYCLDFIQSRYIFSIRIDLLILLYLLLFIYLKQGSSLQAYLSFSSFPLFPHIEHSSQARKKDRIWLSKLVFAIFILLTSFLNSYSILFMMFFMIFILLFLFLFNSFSSLFFALQIKSIFFRLLLSLSLSLLQPQGFYVFCPFSFVIFLPCIFLFNLKVLLNFILSLLF